MDKNFSNPIWVPRLGQTKTNRGQRALWSECNLFILVPRLRVLRGNVWTPCQYTNTPTRITSSNISKQHSDFKSHHKWVHLCSFCLRFTFPFKTKRDRWPCVPYEIWDIYTSNKALSLCQSHLTETFSHMTVGRDLFSPVRSLPITLMYKDDLKTSCQSSWEATSLRRNTNEVTRPS